MDSNVGSLRQQSALSDSDRPVIIVTKNEELRKLLDFRRLKVERFYPDTIDGEGNHGSTFKIEVTLVEPS